MKYEIIVSNEVDRDTVESELLSRYGLTVTCFESHDCDQNVLDAVGPTNLGQLLDKDDELPDWLWCAYSEDGETEFEA